jgi:hypothetical protein
MGNATGLGSVCMGMTSMPFRYAPLFALVLLAACGDPVAAPPDGTPPAAAASATAVRVRIEHGAGPAAFALECGDTPRWTEGDPGRDAAAACATVLQEQERLIALSGPPPTDRVCTDIYGGPEVATIEGRVDGEPVDATVARNNGCGISDWDALAPLLGQAGGPEPVS